MRSTATAKASPPHDAVDGGDLRDTYLTMLGSPKGLAYVLGEQRMAFPPTRRIRLRVGDQLLLYTTRNIFNNPSRDRGRVIGRAEVLSPIIPLDSRLRLAGRDFTSGCELKIEGLAPFGEGVILADLVHQLSVFASDPRSWSARLRRSVLALPASDAALIWTKLEPLLSDPRELANTYLERAASATSRHAGQPRSKSDQSRSS